MTEKIYLETLKSVLGRSISHYSTKYKHYPHRDTKNETEERLIFWIKKLKNFHTIPLKQKTELIPCYAIPVKAHFTSFFLHVD